MSRNARLVWLFDLDNTLHNATPHIFPHISRSMTAYLAHALELGEAAATEVRRNYWLRYGATLTGMMRHHGTDPHHFLRLTHDFPDLPRMLVFERGLRMMLRRLPGRKLVFSNAPLHYAAAVLQATGIADEFDGIYAIEQMRFRPKPSVAAFRRLLHRERLLAVQCIMVDDMLANLGTARRLGMKTVWVSDTSRTPPQADARVSSIMDLPRAFQRLMRRG